MAFNAPGLSRKTGGCRRADPTWVFFRIIIIVALLAGWAGGPALGAAAQAPAQAPQPQSFSPDQVVDLPLGAAYGDAAWGDFNNDGQPDLVVTGLGYPTTGGANLTRTTLFLYNAQKAQLEPIDLGLPQLEASSVAWGDYDNDGFVDLLLTGRAGSQGFSGIYHNVAHTPSAQNPSTRAFTLAQQLDNVYSGAGVWGDYDNDGRLDLLISGSAGLNNPLTRLYHNDGASFSPAAAPIAGGQGLVALSGSAAAWMDYDGDAYPDLALTGLAAGAVPTALVYHNNQAGGFDAPVALTGLWSGTVNWIDDNQDGTPDLLLTGNAGTNNTTDIQPRTLLYRVDASAAPAVFTQVTGTGLPDVWNSSVSVGDYNEDGLYDVALNGMTTTVAPTGVYIHHGDGTFTDAAAGLPPTAGLSLAWGDFNADRTLDLAVTGIFENNIYHTRVYLNQAAAPRPLPAAPVPQAACWDGGDRLTLFWSPAGTDEAGVTYNVRAGTTPDGIDVRSPASSLATGERRLPLPGNAFTSQQAVLAHLTPHQHYKWAVQSVDSSYTGGLFSPTVFIMDFGTPVAVDDTVTTEINAPAVIDVLGNDNRSFSPLSVFRVAGAPQHGTVAVNPDGTLTYTPAENYAGPDSFTYYAVGSSLYCSAGRVTVNVTHTDRYPPTDVTLTPSYFYQGQPAGSLVGTLTTQDLDLPLDSFTYSLVPFPCKTYNNNFFTITGDKLYTAAVFAQKGDYLIRVRSTDSAGKFTEKEIPLSVKASMPTLQWRSPDGAWLSGPAQLTTTADLAGQPAALALRADDPGGSETLYWSIAHSPAHGKVVAGGATHPGEEKTNITYTPPAGWVGQDSFVVEVTDSYLNKAQITVNLTVYPPNQPPTLDAIPDQVFNEFSGEHILIVSGIGPGAGDGDHQTVTVTLDPAEAAGLLEQVTLVYPCPGGPDQAEIHFVVGHGAGEATFTITVADGQATHGTITRQFKVTVLPGPRVYIPMIASSQPVARR